MLYVILLLFSNFRILSKRNFFFFSFGLTVTITSDPGNEDSETPYKTYKVSNSDCLNSPVRSR